MADYSRQLFDMFGSIGDQVVDNRKEAEGKRRYNESAARQMFNDEYNQSRDLVKDKQWADEFNQKNAYNNRYLDVLTQKAANGGEGGGYGLSPVWGTDAEGNPALVQLGKNGQPIQPQLPEGFKIARDPIKMDAGTHFVLLDPQTRQQIGTIPKNVEGEAAANVRGKAQGEAEASLPKALAQGESMLTSIKGVQDDPYRSRGTGLTSVLNSVPATGGYDFQQKVDQLKGQSFLQAFESLKGAGQITEIEGQKATQAIARLNTSQSEEAFGEALTDLKTVVEAGMNRARQRASGQQPQGADEGWTTMSNGVRMRQVR